MTELALRILVCAAIPILTVLAIRWLIGARPEGPDPNQGNPQGQTSYPKGPASRGGAP